MPRIPPFARILRQPLALPILTASPRLPALTSTPLRTSPIASASSSRSFSSLLNPSRPGILASASPMALAGANFGRAGPTTQVRTLAYGNMYQPSQRKRKRKHGFLSRSKGGRLGRKTLARRSARGRRFLSH